VLENGEFTVTIMGGKLKMRPVKGVASGEREARLELIVSSRIAEPMAYLYEEGMLIGASVSSELAKILDPETAEMRGAAEFQEYLDTVRILLEDNQKVANSRVPLLTELYEQVIVGATDRVYDHVFGMLFMREDWEDVRDKMQDNGLVGLENASFAAIRGLAGLSQLSCYPISDDRWQSLASTIREDGDVPDPVDDAIRFLGPQSRMPLMGKKDNYWIVWI
jgi:hypothetical protein